MKKYGHQKCLMRGGHHNYYISYTVEGYLFMTFEYTGNEKRYE